MTDLVAFLRARLDEDEAAPKVNGGWWTVERLGVGQYAGRQDAARTLREVEAKRKILDEVIPEIVNMDDRIISEWGIGLEEPDAHLPLLKILAGVYSDHPDYDPAWSR